MTERNALVPVSTAHFQKGPIIHEVSVYQTHDGYYWPGDINGAVKKCDKYMFKKDAQIDTKRAMSRMGFEMVEDDWTPVF